MAILMNQPTQPSESVSPIRIAIKPSDQISSSPLFRLPPEIRVQIYHYIFLSHTPHTRLPPCPPNAISIEPSSNTILLGSHRPHLSSTIEDFPPLNRLAPLLTSRQFYHEVLPVLYGDFAFHFPENLWVEDVHRWLNPIPLSSRRMIKRVGLAISVYAHEEGDERSLEQRRGKWGGNAWRDPENKACKLLRMLLPRLERVDLSIMDEGTDECIVGTFYSLKDMLVNAVTVFKKVQEVIVGRSTLEQGVKGPSTFSRNLFEKARTQLALEGGGGLMTDEEKHHEWVRWVDVCRV